MLVSADTAFIRYLQHESLYEVGTSTFLRQEWLDAAARGVASAKLLAEFVNFEVKFLAGLLVPWYYLLGTTAVDIGLKYYANRQIFNASIAHAQKLLTLLNQLRHSNPKLCNSLARTAAVDGFLNIPESFHAEDIAFFLGRVIRGVASPAAAGSQIGLRVIAKSFIEVSLILGGLHYPASSLQALKNEANVKAADLDAELQQVGITLDRNELAAILVEGATQPQTKQSLEDIQREVDALMPLAQELANIMDQ